MEHLETPQDTLTEEQGSASALATEEPKDTEEQFAKERFQNCVDNIQKIVSYYPVECRPKVLAVALEQATRGKGVAVKIAEISQEIRRTCDALLDPKAKATIALLSELSSLSGISNVGVDYATDILHSAYGQKHIEQAREQFPDDDNVALLSYVFDMVRTVNKAESRIDQQDRVAKEETAEELQTLESEDEDLGDVAESMVKQWLLNQNYTTKLAFTILYGYHIGDHNTEKLADEISNQYEAEIMAMAKNPASSLSRIEVYMTGVVAELLVWRKNM